METDESSGRPLHKGSSDKDEHSACSVIVCSALRRGCKAASNEDTEILHSGNILKLGTVRNCIPPTLDQSLLIPVCPRRFAFSEPYAVFWFKAQCFFCSTTLLHARSGETFRALLLVELKNTLEARVKLREAMVPLDQTWTQFEASFFVVINCCNI